MRHGGPAALRPAMAAASLAAAVLAAFLLIPARPAVAQEPVPVDRYLEGLAAAEALAGSGIEVPSPALMDRVRQATGLPLAVDLGGARLAIPMDPLLDGLEGGRSRDFSQAVERLAALQIEASRAMHADAIDPAALRRALVEAYEPIDLSGPGLLERIARAAREAISGVLEGLFRFAGPISVVAWGMLIALALGVLLLLRRFRLVPEHAARAAGRGGEARIDWLHAADQALRRGDLHEAVRALYRALVATLAARGAVRDDVSLTAGECRRDVAVALPSLYPSVARATRGFERVAYGHAEPRTEDVEALREAERAARSA